MENNYKFYRESSGEWEDVSPERWAWEAHYNDGTILRQFDDSGIFHQFKEINQSKLHHFAMVSKGKPPIILNWNVGYKLIHFYSNIRLEIGGANERTYRIYCFGYQVDDHKVIMCIMPDDGIVITDDINRIKVK